MKKELMQQALDALNESIDCVRTEYSVFVENYGMNPSQKVWLDVMKSGINKHKAAIAALEAAIAQPAPQATAPLKFATSGPARDYLIDYFATRLKRHDYQDHIRNELAADFVCTLATWLANNTSTNVAQLVPIVAPDCGIKDGESIGQAAAGWAQWCEARGNQMLANFLREAIAQTVRPLSENFNRALIKHEGNCCMFERGVQTLDDLFLSRAAFIKSAQPVPQQGAA